MITPFFAEVAMLSAHTPRPRRAPIAARPRQPAYIPRRAFKGTVKVRWITIETGC